MSASHEANAPRFTASELATALGVNDKTLVHRISLGQVPAPDARSVPGNGKRWTLNTIRSWRIDVADRLEHISKMPPLRSVAA
jgi:hypothetical protein